MIESPEDQTSSPEAITAELIDTVHKLSAPQQKYLLEAIHDWIEDNRKYPRKDCNADVIYSDNNRLAQGTIINISAGGAYLQPDSPFSVGQDVILSFEHPFAENQVKVNGKIVRSDKKGIGVKFETTLGNVI